MSSFHYDFILSKRSSLAKVWLAAHWEKKLSKVQVFETNLPTIVQDIIHPKVPIALHTSSHLLVGLVRIYSRKAKYLLKDCSETLINIKVAFRPGSYEIDSMVKKQKSSTGSEYVECSLFITKKLDLLDHWIPDVSAEIDSTLNQSKHEEITLREESMKLNSLKDYFDDDEGFGEMDNEGSVNAFDQATSYCVSTLERGQSLADSAYGTEDQGLLETFSSSDYYSDPFSSGLTPVKNPSSPLKIARDQLNILPLNVDNLDNDVELCSSPIAITDLTLTDEETKTVEPELAVDQFVQARENELEKSSETFELDEAQGLKRSFGEREDGTDVILESIESINKNVRSPRKKLKRTIIIDVETSLNREVIVDNIAHPERHLSEPKFATPRKKLMKEERNTASLLAKSFHREMTPTLNKLFSSNFHLKQSRDSLQTFTDESTLPEDCTDFNNLSNVNETIAQEEGVALSQEFIPLHDEEYSSDEECSWSRTYEKNEELGESSFNNTSTIDDDAILDENILKDRFCSFVETKIQNAPSNEVTFQQIVGSNVVKLSRKIVAQRFLKCLIMQRDSRLTLNQEESFGVITLKPPSEHS